VGAPAGGSKHGGHEIAKERAVVCVRAGLAQEMSDEGTMEHGAEQRRRCSRGRQARLDAALSLLLFDVLDDGATGLLGTEAARSSRQRTTIKSA
jgi:hypothetical protein